MVARIAALLLSGVALFQQALAQDTIPADLIGTWSSKSNATFTGDVCIQTAKPRETRD